MNLSMSDLECLVLFLRDRHELWRASCAQMGTDPERIAQALVREHARLVKEQGLAKFRAFQAIEIQ